MITKLNRNINGNDITKNLELARELLEVLEAVEDKSKAIVFLNTKDLQKMTGFSKKTVEKLFRDPEFPSCNYGKQQVAEVHAVIKYFSVSRHKEDSYFWKSAS